MPQNRITILRHSEMIDSLGLPRNHCRLFHCLKKNLKALLLLLYVQVASRPVYSRLPPTQIPPPPARPVPSVPSAASRALIPSSPGNGEK